MSLSKIAPNAVLFLAFAALPLALFQNCSEVEFVNPGKSKILCVDSGFGCISPQSETHVFSPVVENPIVDILLVIDESISMQHVIDNVNAGISSLSSVSYPKDTLFAVTNMAPAIVDNQGQVDVGQSYIPADADAGIGYPIGLYPGFIRLVTRASIQASVSGVQNYPDVSQDEIDKFESQFSLLGCDEEWFAPRAVNDINEACLESATQIASTPTYVEAGVTTLKQLLERKSKLFRSGASANVIFISDTHDAGRPLSNSYYGSTGAYSQVPTFSEIKDLLKENSDDKLAGVKFSAIAPMPWPAHPLYDQVKSNLVGSTSADEDEFDTGPYEKSNAKSTFSYLDFVAKSGGVALDPGFTTDWTAAMQKIIESSGTNNELIVHLKHSIQEVVSIVIDGNKVYPGTLINFVVVGNSIKFPDWPVGTNPISVTVEYQ